MSIRKNVLTAGLLAVSAAVLVACGGDVAPTPVASAATVIPTSPATAATATAVLQTVAPPTAPATFPSGVPALGTTASTTLSVATTTATATTPTGSTVTGPAFTVASGGQTASGVLTFGSCVFTVSASSFPPASPLAVGKQVVVNPCETRVNTSGQTADGTTKPASTTLNLAGTSSTAVSVNTQVGTNGSVTLVSSSGATVPVGTVVTVTPTGG